MRIGIFGGSFNPPHKMHIDIAKDLLREGYVDKIIYVPTGSKYKYKNNLIPDNNRFDMLTIITSEYPNMEVSDYELKDYVVYTCETLAHFKELYLQSEICFICGTDNLSYIDSWKNGIEILSNYKILVIKRKGESIDELLDKYREYQDNIIVTSVEPFDLSSTELREKISKNQDVSEYMDAKVLEYIKQNRLYK